MFRYFKSAGSMMAKIVRLLIIIALLFFPITAFAQFTSADGSLTTGLGGSLATGLDIGSTAIMGLSSTTLTLGGSTLTAINIGNSGSTTNFLGTLEQGGHSLSLNGAITTGGALTLSGAFGTTINVGATTNVTLPASGTLASLSTAETFTAAQGFTQAINLSGAGGSFHLTPTAYTTVANPSCSSGQMVFCTSNFFTGSLAGATNLMEIQFSDDVLSPGFSSTGFNLQHSIAPNGNVASGNRVTTNILQNVVGTAQTGATISSGGISGTTLTVTTLTGTIQAGQGIPATQEFSGTGSITAGVLTITVVGSGTLAVGQTIPVNYSLAPSVYNVPPGTTIASLGTGTGGLGTYNLSSATASAVSGTITSTDVPIYTFIEPFGTGGTSGVGSTGTYALNNSGFLASASSLITTGFYTFTGDNDNLTLTGWLQGQIAPPGTYGGANEVLNIACEEFASVRGAGGCSQGELDLVSQSGAIFRQNLGWLFVSEEGQKGQLGADIAEQFSAHVGFLGFARLRSIVNNGAGAAMDPNGIIDQILPVNSTQTLALGMGRDYSHAAYAGPSLCEPYQCTWIMQAAGITASTRMTSDGNTANGYVSEAIPSNNGTGYTGPEPTTVTGCVTAPIVNNDIGTGGLLIFQQPFSVGAGCVAETSATVPAPSSGTQATITVHVTGNTLNLPITSQNVVNCTVNASDTAGDGISYSSVFPAQMKATSSTTTLPSSPTWTTVPGSATTNGAANLGIANPTADTTLGAVNITANPTTASFTGSTSGTSTTLTVSGVTGTIVANQTLSYSGSPAGLTIISGAGSTWTMSSPENISARAMTTFVTATYSGECKILSSQPVL